MPPVTMLYNQLEEHSRRTRSSRLIPVTRGVSPTWGSMMASMVSRRGSVPDQERDVQGRMDRTRRRQGRLASMPDQRTVELGRVGERERGGPPVPHNSLDMSVIDLSETVAINEDPEVFHNFNEVATPEEDTSIDDDSSVDDILGVPPLDPNARAILDVVIASRSSLDTTIDLTDSPVRPPLPSSPQSLTPASRSDSPHSQNQTSIPSSSSLKCPVCLESFSSIRLRGSRLVSTLCGHVFCGRCLPACVRTSGQCPTCRIRLGYQDFHPLYLY